ncbi:hypothetical protein RRG08_021290 [Elysia crispata]|uniref:Uncharacterized protein n=1 Tax=Elysia crispata TaxID=231223 RepID=A0AAE0ZBG9_9GAST|nr:hypothetical protein RRG08_021290 [Elysia crispata]
MSSPQRDKFSLLFLIGQRGSLDWHLSSKQARNGQPSQQPGSRRPGSHDGTHAGQKATSAPRALTLRAGER